MATKKQTAPKNDVASVETEAAVKPARKPRAKKTLEVLVEKHLTTEQITEEEATAILDRAGEDVDLATVVKEVKKRKVSSAERDEEGKVLRTGKNLSGNQPFRGKNYYYDLEVKATVDYDKAFNAAPNQVRLIMRHMEEAGITTPEDAMRGGEIAGEAINSGKLISKIDPAALFAYYRRVMETLGLRLASEG